MKIIFLIRSFNKGGAEFQLVTLANLLKKRGHEVKVAVSYTGGYYKKELDEAGIPIIDLKKSSRWDFRFLIRLAAALRKEQPDILHSYMPTSNLQASLMGVFFKKIKIVWGIRSSKKDISKYSRITKAIYALEPIFSKRADLIISNSDAAKQLLVDKGIESKKIQVINNGVDTDYFDQKNERKKNGLNDDPIVIGTASRLNPVKGFETFIHAIEIFKNAYPDQNVKFIVAGGGNEIYHNKILDLAKQAGVENQIVWLGEQDDMVRVLNGFDIYSSNSLEEGFSNSICQAMSCEVPCVVTDVGDSAKIVGDTGIVVQPGDSQGLAEAWYKMINSDLESLGQRARDRIRENYSLEKLVLNSEKALREVLE